MWFPNTTVKLKENLDHHGVFKPKNNTAGHPIQQTLNN